MMMKHYNISVTGKVQDVFYRQSTLEKANELGINGFVKNMKDGSVYIEAEGTEEILNTLIAWCKQGPELARVTGVSLQEDTLKFFQNFEILE
jgi:acylphosphatase